MRLSPFPATAAERIRWVESLRPPRRPVDWSRANAAFVEEERTETGEVVRVATVLLANRECPWRCVMCDLWKETLAERVPTGAIPAQIDAALAGLPAARRLKLYNAGSFFDRAAIPEEDHVSIARRARGFERVAVECHPALVGPPALRFRDQLGGTALEVAMGLETAEEAVLEKLNKGMTLASFEGAARFLSANGIALRAFVLVQPPFSREEESVAWAVRSAAYAFDLGATAVSLIPTRGGNGAMEALRASGQFVPPKLATLEEATAAALALGRGLIFADTWDLGLFAGCSVCLPKRTERLVAMNLTQAVPSGVACVSCGGSR